MWPIERYAQVGEYIVKEKEMDLYLCGGQNEAYLFRQFVEAMKREELKERVHDLFGRTTLFELAEIIRNAELLVGNDTSGIHFAAAVNTRVFVFLESLHTAGFCHIVVNVTVRDMNQLLYAVQRRTVRAVHMRKLLLRARSIC